MMASAVDGGAEDDDLDVAADAPRQGPNEATAALALESSGTPSTEGALPEPAQLTRKEKRKAIKKLRRKQMRQQAAAAEKAEENAALDDAADIHGIQLEEKAEAEALAKEKADHDEQERLWIEREKQAMEDFQRRQEEERKRAEEDGEADSDGQDSFVDGDGPPEIIWKGNEIIVRKRRVPASVVPPVLTNLKNVNKSTSNPLPPQSSAFAAHNKPLQAPDADEHSRTFGTEQDRTHCPFHIKTGVCRFGVRCSRVHVYPDQSFTLLMRNMYTGPGLTWEHDEGLEYSDEEVAQHYEEFFEDVHSEFLQYGELVNFKVCKNGSSHLRGNVYVHYKTEASAQAAYNAMNGRFYAGKQITCEFVGVTKWRVALCGEFMKGHHRPCSRGTACNFLHCFRNPNGEYDWADWECSRPRYWAAKMAKLFGYDSSLKGGNDESDEDSRRNNGSPRSPRQREDWGHNESRNKNRHRRSFQNDYDGTDRHRAHRRHDRHGHRNRSDSDDDPGTSSKHRVRRGQQRQVTRYRSDSDDASERAFRHKGPSGHRIRGDRYHVDSDDANDGSSRHRPRGSLEIQANCNGSHSDDSLVGWPRHRHKDSHHPSIQDMDERGKDSWKDLDKHSNERQGSKRRKLGRGDRRPSSDSRYTSSNVQDSKHTTERHTRAVGDGQSTGLNQSRHKHKSIPSGKECQSGSHTNDTGREDKSDGKIKAKNSHKIGRGGSAMRGEKAEDGGSSDSDVSRTHELHRGHHDKYREGKRKRRKEEPKQQTSTSKDKENTLLDPDDRWRGTSAS